MTQHKFDPNDFLHDCGLNQDEIRKEHLEALDHAFNSLESDSIPEINKPTQQQLNQIISTARDQNLFDNNAEKETDSIRTQRNPLIGFFSQPMPGYSLIIMAVLGLVLGYGMSSVSTVGSDNKFIASEETVDSMSAELSTIGKSISITSVDSSQSNQYEKVRQKLIPQEKNQHDRLIEELIIQKIDFDYRVNNKSSHIIFIHSDKALSIMKTLNINFVIEDNIIKVEL